MQSQLFIKSLLNLHMVYVNTQEEAIRVYKMSTCLASQPTIERYRMSGISLSQAGIFYLSLLFQGFGVGAFEEDDDDIYGVEDMSRYDMSMGGEQDDTFGWTRPSERGKCCLFLPSFF